LYSG